MKNFNNKNEVLDENKLLRNDLTSILSDDKLYLKPITCVGEILIRQQTH